MPKYFDVIIVGSGAAGLSLALKLPFHYDIAILTKDKIEENATAYAQGGIAAVISPTDSYNQHIEDTLVAGAGLCEITSIKTVSQASKHIIEWLDQLGMPFDKDHNTQYALTQEGGHSQRRIVHAQDTTGFYLEKTLVNQILKQSNIKLFSYHYAIDLIKNNDQCIGLYAIDYHNNNLEIMYAKAVVLATGGISWIYQNSSAPETSSGDGIAMAWRAGCSIANLEFIQFHPTTLYQSPTNSQSAFLLSESLRGEGAYLTLPNKKRFMQDYHPLAELAPRDIVARAIYQELQKNNLSYLYLDISHQPAAFIQKRFPNIYQHCLSLGIDITQEAIPIIPGAHYTCGGIDINLSGETNIKGLYALGEVSHSGLHGANRLASNSLLECLALAEFTAKHLINTLTDFDLDQIKAFNNTSIPQLINPSETLIQASQKLISSIRLLPLKYMGIIRSIEGLNTGLSELYTLKQQAEPLLAQGLFKENLALRNLLNVLEILIKSAQAREESRGTHYNQDYPETKPDAKHTIIKLNTDLSTSINHRDVSLDAH